MAKLQQTEVHAVRESGGLEHVHLPRRTFLICLAAAATPFESANAAPRLFEQPRWAAPGERRAVLERGYVQVPPGFGKLAARHAAQILGLEYAGEIAQDDLFHGHLLLDRDMEKQSPGFWRDSLRTAAVVLYHSAEYTKRWAQGEKELPLSKRTPRSIVGFLNGTLEPVGSLIPEEKLVTCKHYESNGTVHSDELADRLPGLRGRTLDSYQFYFQPVPDGDFTIRGKPHEIYFSKGTLPPGREQTGYHTQ